MSGNQIGNIPHDLLCALLQNPYESLILIDRDGIVRFISRHSELFYDISREEAVGKHMLELNPESKLPRVLETGHAEIGRVFQMKGKKRIVSRIPLRDCDGNIVGAVGKVMFWHKKRVQELVRQIEILEERLDFYEKELHNIYSNQYDLRYIVGNAPSLLKAKRAAIQTAESDLAVLITGETGTGKDVFAHAIHLMSPRRDKPFVKVNCAAIPHELFESELFGYEAGAFTGASKKGKPGKFELADGGSIFLDEVGDLPMPVQAKLLRVLQEQEVERLGGTRSLKLDFRVIAATNRNIKDMLENGSFRRDLYYRLNVFQLHAPPLRDIREDIPSIAYHLLSKMGSKGRDFPSRISPEAMAKLVAYNWPGNVRELQNVLERAATVCKNSKLEEEHLPSEIVDGPMENVRFASAPSPLREAVAKAEKKAIELALEFSGNSRTEASRILGIHRTGLYQKMKRYGLDGN
jgi:transcriptional regulator with PAS, ATPase and Fis domain